MEKTLSKFWLESARATIAVDVRTLRLPSPRRLRLASQIGADGVNGNKQFCTSSRRHAAALNEPRSVIY